MWLKVVFFSVSSICRWLLLVFISPVSNLDKNFIRVRCWSKLKSWSCPADLSRLWAVTGVLTTELRESESSSNGFSACAGVRRSRLVGKISPTEQTTPWPFSMSVVFHASHTRPRDFENWWCNLLTVNSIYMHDDVFHRPWNKARNVASDVNGEAGRWLTMIWSSLTKTQHNQNET